MRFALILASLLTSVALAAEPVDPKTLDVPAEKLAKAKVMVGQLSDENVGVQAKATVALTNMGREALPALLDARGGKPGDDLRERLDRLIVSARKADFDARAELFLADRERKFDHSLLGWNELKVAVKDTKESRLLFDDILRDDDCRAMLLLALNPTEEGKKQFERRWEGKMKEWQAGEKAERKAGNKNSLWPKADFPIQWLPAALLADLLCGRDYHSDYRHAVVNTFVNQVDEAKLARDGKGRYGKVVSEFIRYWIDQQEGRHGLTAAASIAKYMKFEKEVVIGRAERLFEVMVSTGQVNRSMDQLAGTRDPKYINSFRRLFDSDKLYLAKQDGSRLSEIQIRDAGLSMCIVLTEQDPSEYGFSAQYKTKPNDDLRYAPFNYYFETSDGKTVNEKRKAAFAKWAEWEKANPNAIKAKAPDKK